MSIGDIHRIDDIRSIFKKDMVGENFKKLIAD
ncbi:MAG: hypothetical protein K0S61_3175 [Anaerocolumna sp.]|nr:hypothetical protein [Anaerocolumna sp.]